MKKQRLASVCKCRECVEMRASEAVYLLKMCGVMATGMIIIAAGWWLVSLI